MKQLILPAIIGFLFITGCAQNKEKREEYKEDHYKNEMVNDFADSAVAASDNVQNSEDTAKIKTDTVTVK